MSENITQFQNSEGKTDKAPSNIKPESSNSDSQSQKKETSEKETSEKENISIHAQYIRDLSFELVIPPWEMGNIESEPQVESNIVVNTKKFQNHDIFEVSLNVKTTLKNQEKNLFILEIDYAGVFQLSNIPKESVDQTLMVYCPNILFPYVRHIIANLVSDAGFRPISVNPINFYELYKESLQQKGENLKKDT